MLNETSKSQTQGNQSELSLSASKNAETIKNVVRNIKEYSSMVKETARALRESGAIPELSIAIREVAGVVRDAANDISKAAKDLKDSGEIADTVRSLKEIRDVSLDTIQSVKNVEANVRNKSRAS